jgi:hypothetical protein
MTIPSYPKVLTLGSRGTERLLEGPVVVQEKIDGSQFKVGINAEGELEFASHHRQVYPDAAGMFEPVVRHFLARESDLRALAGGRALYLYGEFLGKPRHNTLCYERVPEGYFVLFDVIGWSLEQVFASHNKRRQVAHMLGCEAVQTLHEGPLALDDLHRLLESAKPMLGGPMVEGVVIKNYQESVMIGGQVFPLFCKLVNDKFKEKHAANPDLKKRPDREQEFYESYRTEARWNKAVQHLREQGLLEDAPRDIGALVREVQADILAEEEEAIKDWLFETHKGDLLRTAVRGLPEFYKGLLAERMKEEVA